MSDEIQEKSPEKSGDKSVNRTDNRMNQGAEGSRYVFIPAVAVSDTLMTQSLLQVLCVLGSFGTRGSGWIYPSQTTIARYLGISRQAVGKSIKRLCELGYLQMRPQYDSHGGRRVNEYRLDMNYELPVERDRYALALGITPNVSGTLPPATSEVAPPATSEVAENIRYRTYEIEHTRSVSFSEKVINETSLARSAETAPPTVTAPPERRTRERFDSSALKRDPLYIAAASFLPEPVTYDEWRTWATMIGRLHRANVTAADIPQAVAGYRLIYPKAQLTIRALVNHWSEIREGKSREQQQQLAHATRTREIQQRHATEEAEREAAYRDLERRLGLLDG